ncbi:MAG: hypothetical protein ABGY11_15455 [Candidatus Thioglobus sp.]|jgi:hypothetical protein
MKVFFRKVFAIIAALIILALVSQSMLFIGPALSGWVIMYFDIEPIGSQNVKTLESLGNIFNLALSGYLGYKTYKKIA